MRIYKILRNQFGKMSFWDFGLFLKETMFFDEPMLVYKFDISTDLPRIPPLDDVAIGKGAKVDLEKARKDIHPLPWEFQCDEYDGVEDFFVAKDSNGIQHISWVYTKEHHNRLLVLKKNEAEIKFCLTLPALRGRGIYPRVIHAIICYLKSQGMSRVFMCVHRDNYSSIRGIEKSGFCRVGALRLRKVFGLQISPRFQTAQVP